MICSKKLVTLRIFLSFSAVITLPLLLLAIIFGRGVNSVPSRILLVLALVALQVEHPVLYFASALLHHVRNGSQVFKIFFGE